MSPCDCPAARELARVLAERHAVCDALGITTEAEAANPAGVALRLRQERDEALADGVLSQRVCDL